APGPAPAFEPGPPPARRELPPPEPPPRPERRCDECDVPPPPPARRVCDPPPLEPVPVPLCPEPLLARVAPPPPPGALPPPPEGGFPPPPPFTGVPGGSTCCTWPTVWFTVLPTVVTVPDTVVTTCWTGLSFGATGADGSEGAVTAGRALPPPPPSSPPSERAIAGTAAPPSSAHTSPIVRRPRIPMLPSSTTSDPACSLS